MLLYLALLLPPAVLLFQVGIDPTPFTNWGVLGLLGAAFLATVGMVWRLVNKQIEAHTNQNHEFMNFVGAHREQFTKALEQITQGLAGSIKESNKELTEAFRRQSHLLDRMLLARSFIQEVREMYVQGKQVDTAAIETAIEKVLARHRDLDSTRS